MNTQAVLAVIDEETFKVLGTRFVMDDVRLDDLREWHLLGRIDINPAMCGPVAAMFDSITCAVTVGYVDRENPEFPPQVHFQFHYDYNHNGGGHNGYTVRKIIDVK